MKKENDNFTLEENLALTNEELTSNWTKLASLIKTYEKNISWESARTKAGLLLKDGVAVMYIESVRQNPDGIPEDKPESKPEIPVPKPRVTPVVKSKPTNKTVYHTNYERLLKIAPGLEERLLKTDLRKGGELYGKSEVTGYMNFSLELINQDDKSYYIAIAHYHIIHGDMIADPDMVIRVDVTKMICEALTFQDAYGYKQVYDDYMIRKLVNTKEKNAQNSFLGTWLRNLKIQGHKIKWKERETTGVLTSELVIQYDKKEETSSKTKPETNSEPELKQETVVEVKGNAPSTYTDMETKEIVSAVKYMNPKIEQFEAERKAEEYKKTGKAPNFLLKVIQRQANNNKDNLYQLNYSKMIFLVGDALTKLNKESTAVKLSTRNVKALAEYEITMGKINSDVVQFVVQEYSESSEIGVLVLNMNPKTYMVWVSQLAQNFSSQNDYNESDNDFASRYKFDQWLSKWLENMISKGYAVWNDEIVADPQMPVMDMTIPILSDESAEESAPDTEPVEEKKKADEIPDFEPGQVQLVEAHIKAGITQDDIDWINKHHQGMTITPRRKPMINNTKSREMDKAIHAMKPGFRISATGKMYYEGRSNRSDKRNTGL